MNNKVIVSILLSALFFFLGITNMKAQDEDCNKTKVAVSVDVVDDTKNYKKLEENLGSRPESEWNGFATTMLVEILSEYEPDITFFSLGEGSGEYHYHFKADMNLTIVREDDDEQTGYMIIGQLISNAKCNPNRSRNLNSYIGKDHELKQAMMNLASKFWPMDRNIILHEKDHPSPPRKPDLNIQIEKDFISPLDKESRKTKVYTKVYDCRGYLVCDKHAEGQPVYYQDKIDRLDLKKVSRGVGGYHIANFMVIVTNKDCENEGEYKLEKGIEAENQTIRFQTCQLGGPIVEVEKELIIRGLEVKVKPKRRELETGQSTNIVLTLKETDPEGTEYPVEGKELEVEINGLENGTIKPKNGYTTNSDGEVILDYKAGSNDEKITVTAIFQPEDYPDKATAKNFVKVNSEEFEAKLTITKTYLKILETKDADAKKEHINHRKLNESVDATIDVYLKLTESQDMPIFNQTWKYYTPVDANITSFNYHFKENQHNYGPKYDTNVDIVRNATNRKITEKASAMQLPWVLTIDNTTGKAVKLLPAGYGIAYEINEIEKLNSVVYTDDGPERESKTTTKTKEKSFGVGPVGEEVADPTIKNSDTWIKDYIKKQGIDLPPGVKIPEISNQETVKKIKPDILVNSGDGKYAFGGLGDRTIQKELVNGKQEEKLSYNWNMTINKKK